MAIISVNGIEKEFKVQIREGGIKGIIKSLFLRKYEIKKAVDNISFEIEQGEIVGYIGPNGAGKSTTIKMLVGILQPTKGEVLINGVSPYNNRKENTQNMGVVFGQRSQLWWDIPLKDSINLMKDMYKIPEKTFRDNLKFYSEVLELDSFIDIPVRQLSLGQRMRAEICVALLHNPKLLYLDEPTIGLDVVVKEKIREAIKLINKERNVTVLLTTHDMSDIEKLCNRVMVVDEGKIIYDGDLKELTLKYGSKEKLTVKIESENSLPTTIKLCDGLKLEMDKNENYFINYDSKDVNSARIISQIIDKGYMIKNFKVESMEVEEVIRKVYSIGK